MLRLYVFEEGADAERLDTLSGYLLDELRELDLSSVAPLPAGPAPAGSKAAGVAAIAGGLLVGLGKAAGGLASVVSAVRAWLQRGDGPRTVRLELDGDILELARPTPADQERLVDLFITRHQQHQAD
jgi:hypothetical protein